MFSKLSKLMKVSKQRYLFKSVRTDRGAVNLKEEPFLHIEVISGETRLMLPVEVLLKAGRLLDGLTQTERKLIKKMLGGIIEGSEV